MAERLLVIGADAAGMSAAHQALRTARARGRDLVVVALEAGSHTSYSACGIPYWMAGDVSDGDDLVARTAVQHREAGIDLRMRHEALAVDLDARTCQVRDLDAGSAARFGTEYSIGFDQLLIATGAAAIAPDWSIGHPKVHPVKTLDDGATWQRLLADRPRRAVVVGGGYIGVEAAEAFARRGVRTVLVTRGEQLMSATLEPGTARAAAKGLAELGIEVVTGAEVSGVETSTDGGVHAVCVDGTEYPADVVAVGLGVTPRVELAEKAGLPLGDARARGALVPDERQQVADGVWAAGDCTAVRDRLLDSHWYVPLGTHANKCGRVAGTNIGGGSATFPGSVGTAVTRAGEVELGRTGLMPGWAEHLGLDVVTRRLDSTTTSGYMPGASPMSVWVMADAASGRLLGCQLAGGPRTAKRIDTAATALFAGMTVAEVAYLDLSYAPPFSPTWEAMQIACRSLAERLGQ